MEVGAAEAFELDAEMDNEAKEELEVVTDGLDILAVSEDDELLSDAESVDALDAISEIDEELVASSEEALQFAEAELSEKELMILAESDRKLGSAGIAGREEVTLADSEDTLDIAEVEMLPLK